MEPLKPLVQKPSANKSGQPAPTAAEMESWLISQLAQTLSIPPEEIEPTRTFESYGLDSEAAVALSGDLQEWLGRDLEPTLLFDYPTIEAVVEYLEGEG